MPQPNVSGIREAVLMSILGARGRKRVKISEEKNRFYHFSKSFNPIKILTALSSFE
jgi:hypothetical protein